MTTNVSAVRDIVIVAAVAAAAYFVMKKLESVPDVQKMLNDFVQNNELTKAFEEGMQGTTQTELPEDLQKTWSDRFGVSPSFPVTNAGESGVSASIAPDMSAPVPVITEIPKDVLSMIFAPNPNLPDIQFMPVFTTSAAALGQSIDTSIPAPAKSGTVFHILPELPTISTLPAPAPTPAPVSSGGGGGGGGSGRSSSYEPFTGQGITNIRYTKN